MSQEDIIKSVVCKIVCLICNTELYSNNLKHECKNSSLRKGSVKIKTSSDN